MERAWHDAAEAVDEKWERAFEQARLVREGYACLLNDPAENLVLAASTHDLLVRFLSAVDWRRRRIVTTDSEFHTARRQLNRLVEEGVALIRVEANPPEHTTERLIGEINEQTTVVIISAVFFNSGLRLEGIPDIAATCRRHGVPLLVDAYHAVNVAPFDIPALDLTDAFVVGGGYKYCQLGEGNCFMRVPPGVVWRPVITGWFAEFDLLSKGRHWDTIAYGVGGARFAGSTYDPVSHYRAARVFSFFRERGLTKELLRSISQHQMQLLIERFDGFDADPSLIVRDTSAGLAQHGGFLVLRSVRAAEIHERLRAAGVHTDYRDQALRLGPAPYLSDQQLHEAMDILRDILAAI